MRKATTLIIVICAIVALNTYADKIVTTYYGSKANDAANNPCKGETTRICAIIEMEDVYDQCKKSSYVIEVVKDSLGNILSKKEYIGKPNNHNIQHVPPIRNLK